MASKHKDDPADLQAYVNLITKHQANLRAFILSLMPGSPHVDDVLQETNTVLWQKRNRFEHGTNFIAWAFKIARYEVLGQRHKNKRDRLLVFSERMVDVIAEVETFEESDQEILSALDSCLDKLTDRERELVEVRYTPGRSLKRLASNLGSSPGSLRIALLRIRLSLKKCIDLTLEGKSV